MPKSLKSRLEKLMTKEVYTDHQTGERFTIDSSFNVIDAPPAHVGKQFPYTNAYRALTEGVPEDKLHLIDAPHIKEPSQVEREMAYLGRNGHQRDPKPAKHKHGGQGTVRRSSGVRPWRGDQHLAFRPATNGKTVAMGHSFNHDSLQAA
jgi:hypothetical protein